jgi:hypothetical protein
VGDLADDQQSAMDRPNGNGILLKGTAMQIVVGPVLTNRVIQGLRRDTLITLAHRRLTLLNTERLQEIAGFDQDYLHLGGAPTEVRSYIEKLKWDLREVH